MRFVESSLCLSRTNCKVCRQKDDGREWRRLVGRIYSIDTADLDCPEGLPWIDDESPKVLLDAFKDVVPKLPLDLNGFKPGVTVSIKGRRKIVNDRRQKGKELRRVADKLRATLEPDSVMLNILDQLDVSEQTSGCKGCRAKKLFNSLGKAYDDMSESDRIKLDSIVSGM